MVKKSSKRIVSRLLTFFLIIVAVWFAWEWRQQDTQQTKGVQTITPQNPTQELLTRCLQKAQADYDRNVHDSRSSPAPNLTEIAAQTYEQEKAICQDLYGI